MIDPDAMLQVMVNENTNVEIDIVPDSYYEIWDLDDDKDKKKYFKTIERIVRNSFEYKEFIQYIKQNFGMDKCAFINSAKGTEYKVEQHHYPFTLYDIVEIVYNKRVFYGELLDVEMVAKEVTMLHYKMIIGLIPLSKTVHQLHHDGKLFIPVDKVFGRYNIFVNLYKDFMSPEQLDILQRIESHTSSILEDPGTTLLENRNITISVNDASFKAPNFNLLQDQMAQRIIDIKNNNYLLPTIEEVQGLQQRDSLKDREMKKEVITPIRFVDNKKEITV